LCMGAMVRTLALASSSPHNIQMGYPALARFAEKMSPHREQIGLSLDIH